MSFEKLLPSGLKPDPDLTLLLMCQLDFGYRLRAILTHSKHNQSGYVDISSFLLGGEEGDYYEGGDQSESESDSDLV